MRVTSKSTESNVIYIMQLLRIKNNSINQTCGHILIEFHNENHYNKYNIYNLKEGVFLYGYT